MSARLFGCSKFRRLSSEREDRDLNVREERFMERHRQVCPDCRSVEQTSSMALNMLRAATMEPLSQPQFEERIIRRWRVQSVRESLGYWSPALAGAGIACLAVFAALALIGRPATVHRADLPQGEASNRRIDADRSFPELVLTEKVSITQ